MEIGHFESEILKMNSVMWIETILAFLMFAFFSFIDLISPLFKQF